MAQIILDSNSNLIQGDFDSATVNNRTKLQTSTTNATTGVYVVPNGSATSASVQMANAADPTNASKIVVATNGSTDTQIVSGANGSGTYLPLSFYTNNDIRFQMGTAGELNVRTAPGTVSSGTSGQVLTSGGPGAGVSWGTITQGQIQTELFTAPGTWTKPATCTQVRVTVVGGGGTGTGSTGPLSTPGGGTSSFGPAVSATGGSSSTGVATPGTSGTGTVSVGTALKTGSMYIGPLANIYTSAGNIMYSLGPLVGFLTNVTNSPAGTSGIAYSTTSTYIAGASGSGGTPYGNGGVGGFAQAVVPVSAPVAVTVGVGGAVSPGSPGRPGVGGAVVVEYIG